MKIEINNIDELKNLDGYLYVATPYSNYTLGRTAAFHYAQTISSVLISNDIAHFAPIVTGHQISGWAKLPYDDEIWSDYCRPLLERAGGLLIVKLRDWEESRGIQSERFYFAKKGGPIFYADPFTLLGYHIERIVTARDDIARCEPRNPLRT